MLIAIKPTQSKCTLNRYNPVYSSHFYQKKQHVYLEFVLPNLFSYYLK